MKTEVKLITPKDAEQMLLKNNMNRQVKDTVVIEYSRQMSGGLWKEESGEAIKISTNNDILDGQHRLLALIKYGQPLSFLIVYDLEPDIFSVIDTGVNRTAGDIFHIAGISQGYNHSAIITRYLALKAGRTTILLNQSNQSSGVTLKSIKYSKSELLSVYNGRAKYWDAALLMSDRWRNKAQGILTLSEIGAIYAYFFDISQDDAFTFMDNLCTGVNLSQDNPIKLLRDKLIFTKTNLKFKLTSIQRLGLIIKAWNHFRKGNRITTLRFSRELDNFPIPV